MTSTRHSLQRSSSSSNRGTPCKKQKQMDEVSECCQWIRSWKPCCTWLLKLVYLGDSLSPGRRGWQTEIYKASWRVCLFTHFSFMTLMGTVNAQHLLQGMWLGISTSPAGHVILDIISPQGVLPGTTTSLAGRVAWDINLPSGHVTWDINTRLLDTVGIPITDQADHCWVMTRILAVTEILNSLKEHSYYT